MQNTNILIIPAWWNHIHVLLLIGCLILRKSKLKSNLMWSELQRKYHYYVRRDLWQVVPLGNCTPLIYHISFYFQIILAVVANYQVKNIMEPIELVFRRIIDSNILIIRWFNKFHWAFYRRCYIEPIYRSNDIKFHICNICNI